VFFLCQAAARVMRKAFNAVYGDFVHPPYPPRATVVIGGLVEPQALVQIEALAHREGRNATVLECNE
jgi:enamine deaminase RidA (YjgF/YER057c/UK114 family)